MKLRLLPLVGLLLCFAACGDTTTVIVYSPTLGPITFPTPTAVAQSVQMGTGLSGQTIANPTTSFTSRDTFAFVLQLRSPANTNQALAVITDQTGNTLYTDTLAIQPNTTVVAASFGPLGKVMVEEPSSPATPAASPAPAGTYTLSVFLYPPPFYTDYANNAPFTYTP